MPPPPGLVGWWAGNGNYLDSAGANPGNPQGNATFAPGLVGQAFSLDGSSGYVLIPDSPALRPMEFTVAAWIKGASYSSGSWNTIFSRGTSGSYPGMGCCADTYGLFIYQDKPQLVTYHANSGEDLLTATNLVPPGEWHFIAGSFDGATKKIYYDGVLVATTTVTNALVYDSAAVPVLIGEDWNNNSAANIKFNGLLDEVDLYNRALSDAEVLALYNAGNAGKCGPLSAGARVPYFTDFENGVGPEWAVPAFNQSETLGFTRFTGQFDNTPQALTLTNLTVGQSYTLGFDFYAIDSWDGNSGPDFFNVAVNGAQVFHYTFANNNGQPPASPQSYPGQPDEGRANWGFVPGYVDAIYRNIEIPFIASNSTVTISFQGQGLGGLTDESWGVDNVAVQLTSALTGDFVRSSSLPPAGTTSYDAMDTFTISARLPLLPASATNAANYSLTEAGADGVLGTGDDVNVPLTPTLPGAGGHSVAFALANAPLQPGRYRFQTFTGLLDANSNAVPEFTRDFTVANPVPGRIESTSNDTLANATLLPATESPAGSGFYTAFAAGLFSSPTDVDYWTFNAEAGDVVTIRLESESQGVYPHLRLRNASDQDMAGTDGGYDGVAQIQDFVINTPGTYYLRVWSSNNRSRYWMRLDQSRGPPLETESNDSQTSANPLNLTFSPGLYQARVAGSLPAADTAGDYFRLGTLNAGNSLSVTVLYPTGSVLTASQTLLDVQLDGNPVPLATNAAGNLNFTVISNGVHYLHIATTNRNLRAQYLLNVAVVDGVPPVITGTTLPAEGASVSNIVDRFTLNFSEDLFAPSVSNSANYELRSAGADGIFGTGDDVFYPVAISSAGYTNGLSAAYTIPDGPLQPGNYRLTVSTNLLDRAGNAMAAPFVRNFSVANISGYVLENRQDDVAGLGTLLGTVSGTNGNGTLANIGSAGVGSNPQSIAAGQFNGDTSLDLVTANGSSGNVTVLTNNGAGGFVASASFSTGNNPIAVVVGDFNRDGHDDLAVANYYGNSVTILLGDGHGSFQLKTNLPGFNNPYNLAVADVNGDGRLDLIVPNSGNGTISVLLGNGDGTFQVYTNYTTGSSPQWIAAGDLNNDTKPDLVVVNRNSNTATVLLGNGDGSFQIVTNLATGNNPRCVAIADVTGDGVPDIVTLQGGENSVNIFAGNGDGTFQPRRFYFDGTSAAYALAVADLNGDGAPDIIVPGYYNFTFSVLLNNGAGAFTNISSYGLGYYTYPIGVVVGDFDSDGRPDLAFCNYSANTVSVWTGNPALTLAEDPPGSGLRSVSGRGTRSNSSDVDYWRFSGNAGDQAIVAVEAPGNPGNSSLNFQIQQTDGSVLTSFNSTGNGWGQSPVVKLPYTGTYLLRVAANNDYQGEYRFRVTLARPPLQLQNEGNDSIANAGTPAFTLTNAHLTATLAGYLSVGDSGDYFYLGQLPGGTAGSVAVREPASSGLAGTLWIYSSTGVLLTNSVAGATNFIFTIPPNGGGAYFARLTGSPDGFTGTAGMALRFSGGSDYADLGNWFNYQSFTLSVWLNPASSQNNYADIIDNNHTSYNWVIEQNGGNVNQYTWGSADGGTAVPFTLTANSWQNLTVTRNATNVSIVYLNGVPVGTNAAPGQINYANPPSLSLARWVGGGGRGWNGMMDDLRIFNRALSPAEVTANLTATLTGNEPNLIGWWPFNEGAGTNAFDLSPSHHTAMLVNGPVWTPLAGTSALPQGLHSQYILTFNLTNATPPQITGVNLPANNTVSSNLITAFTVNFSEDMDARFGALFRNVYRTNGHSYLLTDTTLSWPDAEMAAQRLNGHLVTVNSVAENAWLNQTFGSAGELWIGLNLLSTNGNWTWSSGEPFGYSNWSGGNPDNSGGYEMAVKLRTDGTWDDVPPGTTLRGIIEVTNTADADGDGLVDAIDPYPNDPKNAFDLRAAGPDGQFDTGDDAIYRVYTTGYTNGLSAPFAIADGPLQPGNYRFKVTTFLTDRFGNPLAAPFTNYFSITPVSGFLTENRRTNGVSATSLSANPTQQPDGSLTAATGSGTGANPYFIAQGFFNGDTNLDLATANWSSGSVTVLTNDGNANFITATNIPAGNNPISVAVADFNRDTNSDLAVANYNSGTVSILLGNGAGGFTLATNLAGFNGPKNFAIGDFNHDGAPDLAVPNSGGNTITVWFGSGNGHFTNATVYTVGNAPQTVAAGDLNGDGNLDLLVANYSSATLTVLTGNANGAFVVTTNFATLSGVRYVALGDVNGDGLPDAVTVNNNGYLSVFRGNGDGTFQARTDYNIGSGDTYQVVLADINQDGALDALVPADGANRLITLLNNGDGTFGSQISYGAGGNPISLVTGDYNGDGRPDIVTANYSGNNITVWLGNNMEGLAYDPAGTGLRVVAARGNLADGNDLDYWTFSAQSGDRLAFACENPRNPSASGLIYRFYYPDGSQWTSFGSDYNGRGQINLTVPASGTYTVRVEPYYQYYGEYRFRLTLARPPVQLETENNDSIGNANSPTLAIAAGAQTATVLGYIGNYDTAGDYFRLGNLAAGTVISLGLTQPANSGLIGIMTIYNAAGAAVSNSPAGATNLTWTVPTGGDGLYYARVQDTGSASGILTQYLLNIRLSGAAPPTITSITLPAEGATVSNIIDRFSLTFSQDMYSPSVTNPASYELRSAGPDNVFGDGDDQLYTVVNSPFYTSGTNASYLITDGPLQPGLYRFTANTNLQDRLLDPMTTNFVRNFAVTNLPGFVLESRSDDSLALATSLSVARSNRLDGSFSSGSSLGFPVSVERIAAGRINGDTNLDLAVTLWNSGSVGILLGNGDGSFTLKTNVPTGSQAWSVAAGNFNADSNLDLAVANYGSGTVSILLGNGDGSFSSASNIPVGANPYHVVIGDFDKDGKSDLAVANFNSGNISVLLGNGDGTFRGPFAYNTGGNPAYLAIGDVNGDGKPDLAVANYGTSSVNLLLGNGDGSFAPAVNLASGLNPRAVVLADLNGDGKPDLAVFNSGDNTVSVLLGNGDGSFQRRVNYPTSTSDGYELLTTDLNGDGRPDLIVGGYNNSLVSVLMNNGDGTFQTPETFGLGGHCVGLAAGDFNNDGRLDLAAGSDNANAVYTLLGNDTETLASDSPDGGIRMGAGRGNVASGDYDYWSFSGHAGDRLELAVENPGDPAASGLTYRIYFANGNQWTAFSSDYYGRGQLDAVLPVTGTYYVRVEQYYSYVGEYRFRVTLAKPPVQQESEDNNSVGQANVLNFANAGGHRTASVLGYESRRDGGTDFFALGNLSAGAVISLTFSRPNSSPLIGQLAIYNASGTLLTNAPAGQTNLVFVVPATNAYFANLSAANNSAGLFATYILNLDVADATPAVITSVTLPANGTTNTSFVDRFTLGFSKDLDPALNALNRPIQLYGGHAYTITDGGSTWFDAEAAARAWGGHLVTIGDVLENAFVQSAFSSYGNVWIGLSDEAQHGSYVWSSGDPLTYTNWSSGQPNNAGSRDYVALQGDGTWADFAASANYRGVVEVNGPDSDGDGIPDTLDPYPYDPFNVFDLRAAGPDGVFDTADDQVYHLTHDTYTSGLSLNFYLADGPLQPGYYRFTVTSSLRDLFGNGLAAPYVSYFTIAGVSGYVNAGRTNTTFAAATPLPLTEDPAGMKTAAGRGKLFNGNDVDYWSFTGTSNDLMVLGVDVPGNPAASGLHYQIFRPDGSRLADFYPSYYGDGQTAAYRLTTNGTYYISVSPYYGYYGEYRLRVTTLTSPLQAETEDNGSLANANPVSYTLSSNTASASIGGYIHNATDLDYFNLGTVSNGYTIFLSVRQPVSSPLAPVVSVYNSANVYQPEAAGGRADDGVAEVPITQTGSYYALVRGGQGTGGLDAQYLLDIETAPSGAVSFPNLQVVSVTPPSGGGIQSGQLITYSFTVRNVGSLATPSANWTDRAVLSTDTILGNGDDIPLGFFPHNGVLNPGESYSLTNTFALPDGISGDYYVIVFTDAGNAVNEFVFENDNTTVSTSTFHVNLAPYPDLRVENLAVTGPDANHVYSVAWNTANRGTGTAPAGFYEHFQVRNLNSGALLADVEQPVNSSLAPNATLPHQMFVTASNAANYQVQVTTDSRNNVFEDDAVSHADAEANNTATAGFSITAYYTVALQSSPPGAGLLTGAGTYSSGSPVTVTAVPLTNTLPYQFVNWTEGGAFQSAGTNYSFIISGNRSLTANFTLPSFQITASNNPPGAGIVAGQGTYFYGTTNVLTASANYGWRFTNWTENGTVIATAAALTNLVTSNRFVVANYVEANTVHYVTTATSPANLATVTGGGTYHNGETAVISAPAAITNPPNIYTFREFQLNGALAASSTSFNKTFSTLDPTNMNYVAVYDVRSILPVVIVVTPGFTNTILGGFTIVTNPVPASTNYQITLQFDRTMDPTVTPVLVITNAIAAVQPVVPTGGVWFATRVANDTYRTPFITLSNGMDGPALVQVSGARDPGGAQMAATNVAALIIDVTPPTNPVIALVASNSSSALISWSSYAPPEDLGSFRVYLETNSFSSVGGRVPVSSVGSGTRSYWFTGLALDRPYYAAVVAVDAAGNSSPMVTPLSFTLASAVPPPVPVLSVPVGASSANISWNNYNTSQLLGFAGFKLYYETSNFVSVAGLTPKQTLSAGARSVQIDNLDRTKTYYFAVVGYNVNGAFNPNVTTTAWSDPYAGNIGVNMTLGAPGQLVDIFHSITVVSNAIVTVPAGVTLRFAPGTGLTVQQGALFATGTALDPVIFTSANDQPGLTPAAGDWNGITLQSNAGASVLMNVFVKFGGGLTVDGCAPTVQAFSALNNLPSGLTLQNGATLNTANALLAFNGVGARQLGTAQLTLTNSVIKNNGTNALATGGLNLRANGNWWGAADAATIAATLRGAVDSSGFLTGEPLLTPAIGTSNNVTQVGTPSINLRLACRTAEAMRLSEDSTFNGVFFAPFTNATPFALSSGGGQKTIFAQFRSVTGQTSAPVSVTINYITAGPAITAFNLSEGQVLTRPLAVTGSATAALGVADVEFYLDGVGQGTNGGGSFSQWFDVRPFSIGTHRAQLLARDINGSIATRTVNVVISPTPPPPPAITTPAADLVVNTNQVTIAGNAEPFIPVRLFDNGALMAVTSAAANGTFNFPGVSLTEGANQMVAMAQDALGSANSTVRTVDLETLPPAELVMNPPDYTPGRGLTLTWVYPTSGKRATSFEVFWSAAPISNPAQAIGHTTLLTDMSATVQGLATGDYYFYVVGYDNAGNASPLSAPVTFHYDAVPPSFTLAFNKSSPVGVGPVHLILTASEALAGPPTLTVQPAGFAPSPLTLSNSAVNTYEADINITPLLPSGPVQFTVSGQDLAGNSFNGTPSGPQLVIDVTPPSGVVSTAPLPPVQATNTTGVQVNLLLTEPPAGGAAPALSFGPPIGAPVSIGLTGAGTNWNGTLTVTPAMGSGIGHFTLSVTDALANVGHEITAGEALEIYNTALPSPPGQPVGFRAVSLAGGQILLTWSNVPNAEIYRVYSSAATNVNDFTVPTTLIADNLATNRFVDLPAAEGYYRYVVTASRRGAEGTNSIVRVALSDRTPPPAPTNVAVQLAAAGLQITWQPGAGETPDHFNVYRNGTLIRTVSSATPVIDNPPRGEMTYTVGADDALGNEALSQPAIIEMLVGAVNNLQALADSGQPPVLSWSSSDGTAVGFNVYRNGIRQNSTPLAATSYADTFAVGSNPVTYAVTAVNATNAESAARSVTVYSAGLGLLVNAAGGTTNNPPVTGYFDDYVVSISNLTASAALPLQQVELLRQAAGTTPLNIVNPVNSSIAAGGAYTAELSVPCASNTAPQTVRVRAVQQTDAEGSSVIYQQTFSLPGTRSPGVMVQISANQLPLAGGLTPFNVQIYNRGYTPIYFVTARGNGAQPGDLYISVKNPQGQEVSRSPFTGTPAGIIFNGGVGYVMIPPGSSTTLTVPDVLTPAALASNLVTFQAVVSTIYDRVTPAGQQSSGPLVGSMQSFLSQTPYYGTAQTDRQLYSGDQPVVISGQALDRLTGQPVPNVPLKIGFATRGYRWYQDVTTDNNGNYSYTYSVTPGLAGTLTIWAAHPDVVDQLNQAQITIYRMYAAPPSGDIRMSKNDTLPFTIALLNPGDVPLTGFTTSFQAYQMQGTNPVPISTLHGTNLTASSFSLDAGQRGTVTLQLAADAAAPDNAMAVFTLTSAEGASATFTANVTLLPAVPIVSVVDPNNGYVEVSLDRGSLLSRQVTIVNSGLKDLKGVSIVPPTNVTWMSVNLPAAPDGTIPLPDLPVGGTNAFTVVFTPPPDTGLGFFQDKLTIRGTNAPGGFDVNLYARVTSSQQGAVQFYVDDILGLDVPNATVRLRNTALQVELPPVTTDINGLVTVTNLQEGDWSWQVGAAGYSANVGTVTVIPDQTVQTHTRLNKSLVTINFTVTPVPFTDKYDITIEQTFETHVPIPVLVMTPAYQAFTDVKPGFQATFIATAKNEGLVQMTDLSITGQQTGSATLTPLITYVPVLGAQQSIDIPFVVTYSGTNAPGQQGLGDAIAGCLGFGDIDTLADFIAGMAAFAQAYAQCPKDATLIAIATSVAVTMQILNDAEQAAENLLEPVKLLGCILGNLIGPIGLPGIPVAIGTGGGVPQQSVAQFTPVTAGCFAGDTSVRLADGTCKRIDRIQPGDAVKSGGTASEIATVAEIYKRMDNTCREIRFAVPGQTPDKVLATDEHLFWVDGKGWVAAADLKAGDWLMNDHGQRVQIVGNERIRGSHEVYTLKLRGDTAFYANGILVHDLCGAWTTPAQAGPGRTLPAPKPLKAEVNK